MHHRLELARGVKEINNVMYVEAENASKARLIGAMQNIAEGQGTATDAAKIIRESKMTESELADFGLSMTDSITNKGAALAKLSDAIFQAVIRGDISENVGAIIGNNIESHDIQEQFYNNIKGRNYTNSTIEIMAQDMSQAPVETQSVTDLFGTTEVEIAAYEERANLIAGVRSVISKAKNILKSAVKNKDFLSEYVVKLIKKSRRVRVKKHQSHWQYSIV